MSSSERRPGRRALLLGLGALVALPGCLRPMLAEEGAASQLRGQIALPPIDGRVGYYLHQRLRDRLGKPEQPLYRLEVALTTRDRGLAIAQDNTVTRRMVTATARWRLVPVGGGAPLMTRVDVARSGYNATGSLYATQSAERAIERRLAEEMGERIAREVLARADRIAADEAEAPSPPADSTGPVLP